MSEHGKLEMPRTETPVDVYFWLLILTGLLGLIFFFLFGIVGIMLMILTLAFTTPVYAETTPGFHAIILLNHLTGTQRTVFQGLNFKLPWETVEKNGGVKAYIDLRVDIHQKLNETYPTQDGLMKTEYVDTFRPDFSGDNPGDKIILFATFEAETIKTELRALLSQMLSDHYGKNTCADLLNKDGIMETVFKSNIGKKLIGDFEDEHAVKVSVRLTDSDYDKRTQKFRDTISAAKSFNEAIKKLMETDAKMTIESATRIVKLMNLENTSEVMYDVDLDAKGLENLRDVNLFPGSFGQGSGGVTKKQSK